MPKKKKINTEPKNEKIETEEPKGVATIEETDRLHKKKTKEEYESENEELVKELENTEETPEETPENTEETEEPETDGKEEEPKVDYKKRYQDSSREAHILNAKNRKMAEAIEKASDLPEPTEEELMTEYPDWEDMSDFERKIAKRELHTSRQVSAISEVSKAFKDMDAWNKKIDDFLGDPETLANVPDIDGKEDEFRVFASKESRRGVDMETLVSAFFYEADKAKPPKKTGQMFESGSGGQPQKPQPKTDKLSVEESMELRKNDYKKYVQMLREGKIDNSTI